MPPALHSLTASRRGFVWSVALLAAFAGTHAGSAETFLDARHQTGGEKKAGIPMADGLTTVPSSFGVKETVDRLEAAVKAKGLTVFARIDHAGGATAIGLALRPTELVIFGNARGGTPLMQAGQSAGIDLPLKAVVYEDAAGKVWLAYNDPAWVARRHALGGAVDANVKALTDVLVALAHHATQGP